MSSIDDIFKNVGVPSKRKLDAITDPNQVYQSNKLASSRGASARGDPGAAADAEGNDDDDGDDDLEAGPAPPPPSQQQEEGQAGPSDGPDVGEDEEGRFFGGGISKQQSDVLDFVADAGEPEAGPVKIDTGWMRKTAQSLEKHIAKNAELRAKHEHDPQKFIGSEADLDADIKSLSILSDHPELYPDFAKLGTAAHLVGLLAHDNTDIAIDALEIIGELTDEDVTADDAQWDGLVDALIEADVVGLLVSSLSRLDEDDETDRNGVYFALGIVENLCSRSATAARIGREKGLLKWLLERIQRREYYISQNRQYAAEILAILAQSSAVTRCQMADENAVDVMLRLVWPYRKHNPIEGGEEEEYMENLFEALTCLVDEPSGKAKFVEAEGVELCLIMFKAGRSSKTPSLRLMDHAATGGSAAATDICLRLVDGGGLKALFTLFGGAQDQRLLGHLLGLLASLLRQLPHDSPQRIRMLAKFVERDYDKTARLVRLRAEFGARVRRAEAEHRDSVAAAAAAGEAADPPKSEVRLLSRRLDAGLYDLQQVDVSLAWLAGEDDGARRRIQKLLAGQDEDLATVAATLKEQREALDTTDEDSREMKDMLSTLLDCMEYS